MLFFFLLALLCLGLLNWHLVILAIVFCLFLAYPVLMFIPIMGIVVYVLIKEK